MKMDLKNAVAVCLLALFASTLVLLVARALDLQAASRLEPKLTEIAEELRAIRRSGSLVPTQGAAAESGTVDDGLVVYYFHGSARCPTCEAIESQSHDLVQSDFASFLERGRLSWKVVNYEQPAGEKLAQQFEVQMPVVVLAQMKGGQIESFRRLDNVWGLVGDKAAFAEYVRGEIRGMLEPGVPPATESPQETPPAVPLPETPAPGIPLPAAPALEVPLPTAPADKT